MMTTMTVNANTVASLAKRVHDFLYEYDPCFGYAQGLEGEQNEAEWCETLAEKIMNPASNWIEWAISRCIVDNPAAESVGDDILGDIAMLNIA